MEKNLVDLVIIGNAFVLGGALSQLMLYGLHKARLSEREFTTGKEETRKYVERVQELNKSSLRRIVFYGANLANRKYLESIK